MTPGFVVWDENQTTMQIDDWKKKILSSLKTNWMISLFVMGKTITTTMIRNGKEEDGDDCNEFHANGCDMPMEYL